jgi:hypothetical protein
MILANFRFDLSFRRQRVALLLVLFATLLIRYHLTPGDWRPGWEYEWVALPLAAGHGYSFEMGRAWLGPYPGTSEYSPTAWIEPLHTVIMAASFRIFGEHGRLVLVLINFIWVGAACWLVFLLVERLVGSMIGMATAVLFALLPFGKSDLLLYIGNAGMACFLFIVCAWLLIRCLEHVSVARSLALGGAIGIANLTHAGSLLFAPLAAVVILIGSGTNSVATWKSAALVLVAAICVVAPWTVRNCLTFDRLVIVRNGFGFNLYIGNPTLAQTFVPGLQIAGIDNVPPWTAAGPRQALATLRDLEHDRALRNHALRTINSHAPSGYQLYNEAQRDHVFLSRAVAFILDKPLLSARMMFWKAYAFFAGWGLVHSLIAVAASLGWLVMMRDIRATSLMLLLLAYASPYVLSLPMYYRYRSPAEPIMFVLIGLLLGTVAKRLQLWLSAEIAQNWGRVVSLSRKVG